MGTLILISLVLVAQADAGITSTAAQQREVEAALETARELLRSTDTNKLQLAVARLEQCTTKVPDALECWNLLATAFMKIESVEKARRAFEKYLELSEPKSAPYQQRYPWVDYPSVPK